MHRTPCSSPRRAVRALRAAALLAVIAVLGAACGTARQGAGDGLPLENLTGGEALPAATLTVLGDDTSVELAPGTLTGPTVINFWATWCVFCVEEMPDFEAVHRDLGGAVRFIGIDREDSTRRALELAARTGVTYDLLEDRDGGYFALLKGRGMPTTVFVAADGTIVYRHAGPLTAEALRDLIRTHLDV